ncbi:unnamed protein product [Pleuronectes platessa]|uniref:Uncharacterized protein n=1 Tax=Pleuronectes platessa TaxID=8262 RepID=A0A9N7TM69_PLEPL|nr:unnamed protein product [Pleuronectes platessa]
MEFVPASRSELKPCKTWREEDKSCASSTGAHLEQTPPLLKSVRIGVGSFLSCAPYRPRPAHFPSTLRAADTASASLPRLRHSLSGPPNGLPPASRHRGRRTPDAAIVLIYV